MTTSNIQSSETAPARSPALGSAPQLGGGREIRPILVTGMHRSGTTWLGHMLCAGGRMIHVGEPLNVLNRQTILRSKVDRWYTYIGEDNEDLYLRHYKDAVAFRPHPIQDIRRARLGSPRDPHKGLVQVSLSLAAHQAVSVPCCEVSPIAPSG